MFPGNTVPNFAEPKRPAPVRPIADTPIVATMDGTVPIVNIDPVGGVVEAPALQSSIGGRVLVNPRVRNLPIPGPYQRFTNVYQNIQDGNYRGIGEHIVVLTNLKVIPILPTEMEFSCYQPANSLDALVSVVIKNTELNSFMNPLKPMNKVAKNLPKKHLTFIYSKSPSLSNIETLYEVEEVVKQWGQHTRMLCIKSIAHKGCYITGEFKQFYDRIRLEYGPICNDSFHVKAHLSW